MLANHKKQLRESATNWPLEGDLGAVGGLMVFEKLSVLWLDEMSVCMAVMLRAMRWCVCVLWCATMCVFLVPKCQGFGIGATLTALAVFVAKVILPRTEQKVNCLKSVLRLGETSQVKRDSRRRRMYNVVHKVPKTIGESATTQTCLSLLHITSTRVCEWCHTESFQREN